MVSGVASVTEGILSDPGRGGIKAEVGRTGAGSHDKGDEATSPAGMSSDTGAHAPELMIDGMYTCPCVAVAASRVARCEPGQPGSCAAAG